MATVSLRSAALVALLLSRAAAAEEAKPIASPAVRRRALEAAVQSMLRGA